MLAWDGGRGKGFGGGSEGRVVSNVAGGRQKGSWGVGLLVSGIKIDDDAG